MNKPAPKLITPKTLAGTIHAETEGKYSLRGRVSRAYRAIFTWDLPFSLIVNSIALQGRDVFDAPRDAEILQVTANGKTSRKMPAKIAAGELKVEARLVAQVADENRKFDRQPTFWLRLNCCRPLEPTLETAKAHNPLETDQDGFPTASVAIDDKGVAHPIADPPDPRHLQSRAARSTS